MIEGEPHTHNAHSRASFVAPAECAAVRFVQHEVAVVAVAHARDVTRGVEHGLCHSKVDFEVRRGEVR